MSQKSYQNPVYVNKDGVDVDIDVELELRESKSNKGMADGYAGLNSSLRLEEDNIPSRIFQNSGTFPEPDLNNIKTSGWFYCGPATLNRPPESGYYYIEVIAASSTQWVFQRATGREDPTKSFVRTCIEVSGSPVWQAWTSSSATVPDRLTTPIQHEADANNCILFGVYSLGEASSNAPDVGIGGWTLVTIPSYIENSNVIQVAYKITNPLIRYSRVKPNSGDDWSGWVLDAVIPNRLSNPNTTASNADDCTAFGVYRLPSSATNKPTSGDWTLTVFPYDSGSYITQVAYNILTGVKYTRVRTLGSGWQAWTLDTAGGSDKWTEASGSIYRPTGNVSIGTTSADAVFNVNSLLQTVAVFGNIGGTTHRTHIGLLGSYGAVWLSGNPSPNTANYAIKGLSSATQLNGESTIYLSIADGEQARLTSAGLAVKKGASASYPLDVTGDVNFTGNLRKGGVVMLTLAPPANDDKTYGVKNGVWNEVGGSDGYGTWEAVSSSVSSPGGYIVQPGFSFSGADPSSNGNYDFLNLGDSSVDVSLYGRVIGTGGVVFNAIRLYPGGGAVRMYYNHPYFYRVSDNGRIQEINGGGSSS